MTAPTDTNEFIQATDGELKKFGKRVKNIRNRLGLLQKDFAQSLGISGGHLSEIEAGKTKSGYELFRNIFLAHKVNLNYLFEGSGAIFLKTEKETLHEADRIDFGEDNKKVKELIEFMRKSPVIRMTILASFDHYKFGNRELIQELLKEMPE